MSPILQLQNVFQSYGDLAIIKNMSFKLSKGSIGCLLGPSGCGKTTILRAIAGFEEIMDGRILLNDTVISSKEKNLKPEKRKIGMVFQDYALFPHLTVSENIAFGLRHIDRTERILRINNLLDTLALADMRNKYPHELSGGQQQRVALARALAPKPDLILMDEPFSNLDVNLREKLSMEVRNILKAYGATALIVTHNQLEAFAISDEIGIMSDGHMHQWDTAHKLYHQPANEFVADFVGEGVLLQGEVLDKTRVSTGIGMLNGRFHLQCNAGHAVNVLIRPDDILHEDDSQIKAKVLDKTFRGASIMYSLLLENGEKVLSLVPSHHQHDIGMKIGIKVMLDDIVLFPRDRQGELNITGMSY
ncbi:MAG: ABC transporter ATP-binding protein [Nitrospira sp.]|nr:ABC transporter ATP-binding protein [Nitrospira sp.]